MGRKNVMKLRMIIEVFRQVLLFSQKLERYLGSFKPTKIKKKKKRAKSKIKFQEEMLRNSVRNQHRKPKLLREEALLGYLIV